MTRLFEETLQQAFLGLLQQHDLFPDGEARFVHVYEQTRDSWRAFYYYDGVECQAAGTYTGTHQSGEFRLAWAITPTPHKRIEYNTTHPYPLKQPARMPHGILAEHA